MVKREREGEDGGKGQRRKSFVEKEEFLVPHSCQLDSKKRERKKDHEIFFFQKKERKKNGGKNKSRVNGLLLEGKKKKVEKEKSRD